MPPGTSKKPRTRYCPHCKERHPLEHYPRDPETKRRSKLCKRCRWRREQETLWDWAKALLKSRHMSDRHDPANMLSDRLDSPTVLRGIMAAQERRCAISGRQFYLPSLKSNETLAKLRLRPHERRRLPRLVRIDPESTWDVGNVVFVLDALGDACEEYGGPGGLRALAERMNHLEIVVPQTAQVERRIFEGPD
jgi:hypothetical protein